MRILLAVAAVLLLPSPAGAATATSTILPAGKLTQDDPLISLVAAPGEANRVVVREEDGAIRFTDAVPMHAGEGCEQVAAQEVRCRTRLPDRPLIISVQLGDGDDTATSEGPGFTAIGGPGADALAGGSAGDVLVGGRGHDRLDGGGGGDVLSVLGGAGEGDDRLAGGPGLDTLSFGSGRGPAEVDLATGRAVTAGSRLDLEAIEGVDGSPQADRITGGADDDRINGAGGDDVVDGRGGDDDVTGGDGRDVVRGGRGDDRLEVLEEVDSYLGVLDPGANRIACGPGSDTLESLSREDTVSATCERVAGYRLAGDLRRPGEGHLAFSHPCGNRRAACPATLRLDTVRGGGRAARPRTRLLTRRYVWRGPRRSPSVRARLGRRAKATLRRERATRVLVRLRTPDEQDFRWFIRLGPAD